MAYQTVYSDNLCSEAVSVEWFSGSCTAAACQLYYGSNYYKSQCLGDYTETTFDASVAALLGGNNYAFRAYYTDTDCTTLYRMESDELNGCQANSNSSSFMATTSGIEGYSDTTCTGSLASSTPYQAGCQTYSSSSSAAKSFRVVSVGGTPYSTATSATALTVQSTSSYTSSFFSSSSTSSSNLNTSSPNSSSNTGAIVGGIVGAIVVVVIAIGLFWYFKKQQKSSKYLPPPPPLATNNSNFTGPANSFAIAVETNKGPNSISDRGGSSVPLNTSFIQTAASGTVVNEGIHPHPVQDKAAMFNLTNSSENQETDYLNVVNWSIAEAAAWIFRNGGGSVGATKVTTENINGKTLLTEPLNDLLAVIPTETFGGKTQLREALAELQNSVAPPTY
ncbi:hypothetical protein HK100_011123 [Physocladia obscura]|uniref:Uncharacterized protein n=1 Tax=Physocladia obscura TaxID=109957 RepID=A0AAD5T7Q0_9FUNG|nr:hypothetical protein HK100_011123 [Physocladia obscura]